MHDFFLYAKVLSVCSNLSHHPTMVSKEEWSYFCDPYMNENDLTLG